MTSEFKHSIVIKDLAKKYHRITAINQLNIAIPAGVIVGLMGENGCGKSTLLNILAGQIHNYQGEVAIYGERPSSKTKSFTSFLPDTSALPKNLTATQVTEMYADFFADFDPAIAQQKLAKLSVPADRSVSTLSKGQCEKMQIAMMLARRAKLYLLDEPISGIDPAAREQILEAIIGDIPENATMIISTHLIHDIEPIIDYGVYLKQGKVLTHDYADSLREKYQLSLDQIFKEIYR